MNALREEKVIALARAAVEGMTQEAQDSSADEVLSGALTAALWAVQVAIKNGGDPVVIRNGIHTLLMECPSGPTQ